MLLDLLSGNLREPAECIVKVGAAKQEITDLYPFLTEVTVDTRRDRAAVATLRFETRRDEQGHWSVQDAGVFAPWEPILIEAAFGSYSEEVMRGYVREVRADYPSDAGSATVSVECQDDSLALDREHLRREWGAEAPVTDYAIVSEITVQRHGLRLHADCAQGLGGLVLLQDTTDNRFLRERAAANGYELIFHAGEVYFGSMRVDAKPQSTILVYAGADTHCVHVSIRDDGHQPDKVAFDIADEQGDGVTRQVLTPDLSLLGTESADSTDAGLDEFTWTMSRRGGRNADELAARAQQLANQQSMRVRAEGELDGSLYAHVLRVGEPVPLDGVGQRYGGVYYVDSVNHRFDMQGYKQRFTLLRNAYGDNIESAASPLAGLI